MLYGSQLVVRDGATPDGAPNSPESLPEWLSQRYVSNFDLQNALSSLELGLLQNISLLVGRRRGESSGVEDAQHDAALTREVRGEREEACLAPQGDLSLISFRSSRTST